MNKKCSHCKKGRHRDQFHRNRSTADGLDNYCKQCKSAWQAAAYRRDIAESRRLGREEYARNPVAAREKQLEAYRRLRERAIELLGGKCVLCDFSDPRALQIDHIHGGGGKEQRRMAERNVVAGRTKMYQLLCANCNAIKRIERGEVGRRNARAI